MPQISFSTKDVPQTMHLSRLLDMPVALSVLYHCGCIVVHLFDLTPTLENFHKILLYTTVSLSPFVCEAPVKSRCLSVTFSFHTFPFGIWLDANASPSAEYICRKLDPHTPRLPVRRRITQSSALEKKHMSRGDWWLASRPLKRCERNTNRLRKLIAALAREPFVVWIWCKALRKPQARCFACSLSLQLWQVLL